MGEHRDEELDRDGEHRGRDSLALKKKDPDFACGALRKIARRWDFGQHGLLDQHTDREIANILNDRDCKSCDGSAFTQGIVKHLRFAHGLKSRERRLREAGMVSTSEIAAALGVSICTIKIWRAHGLLQGVRYNDKGEWLYAKAGADSPMKQQGRKLSDRNRPRNITTNRTKEV